MKQIILETITEEYIRKIWNDCLYFLKNIKRMETPKQMFDINIAVLRWLDNEFMPKIEKNMFGIAQTTEAPQGIMTRATKEFKEFIQTAFIPNRADIVKYFNKHAIDPKDQVNEAGAQIEVNLLIRTIRTGKYTEGDESSVWQNAFAIFKDVDQSKYVNIKKRIDDYFTKLISYNDKGIPELHITDEMKVEGVPLRVAYTEGEEKL